MRLACLLALTGCTCMPLSLNYKVNFQVDYHLTMGKTCVDTRTVQERTEIEEGEPWR